MKRKTTAALTLCALLLIALISISPPKMPPPPEPTPKVTPPLISDNLDLYREYIASVILIWGELTEDERQVHREIILKNGVMFMHETTASMLGVWDGYPKEYHADND
jgi:hypothetical protein